MRAIATAPRLSKQRRYHTHNKFKIILCLLFQYIQVSQSRTWMDAIDPSKLINDGMPRVLPPSRKTTTSTTTTNDNDKDDGIQMTNPHNNNNNAISKHQHQSSTIKEVKITIQGSTTSLFTEVNPYRITSEPSVSPSSLPSFTPSTFPSSSPTSNPSSTPTSSSQPTSTPSYSPTIQPTSSPNYNVAPIPSNPKGGYFNYEPTSPYGPSQWSKVTSLSKLDPGYFFHNEYDLGDSAIKDLSDFNRNSGSSKGGNDCGSNKKQSPIDVCVRPKDSCTETHEMRPKSGDYKMNEELITKQILSNKLRLIMTPRTGEEPDPPQIDFSSNGRGIIDMTNIDIKFPSEHSVCGMKFDGEMQYFTYHPIRKRFVAVSFFLDGSEGNPKNEHLQEVIDAFKVIYKEDERKCNQRKSESEANSFASGFGGNNKRMLFDDQDFMMNGNTTTSSILDYEASEGREEGINSTSSSQHQQRRLALKWHPFHPDIQKTVHFWGYSGSFTDPPCTRDIVDWKIMDVPTPISSIQLKQLKHLLYTHVDDKCRRTSVHNSQGSVARPTQPTLKYYKCTRDDYVSDEERAICGDDGCVDHWFGAGLNKYYPPLVDVTGPPTRSPSK